MTPALLLLLALGGLAGCAAPALAPARLAAPEAVPEAPAGACPPGPAVPAPPAPPRTVEDLARYIYRLDGALVRAEAVRRQCAAALANSEAARAVTLNEVARALEALR